MDTTRDLYSRVLQQLATMTTSDNTLGISPHLYDIANIIPTKHTRFSDLPLSPRYPFQDVRTRTVTKSRNLCQVNSRSPIFMLTYQSIPHSNHHFKPSALSHHASPRPFHCLYLHCRVDISWQHQLQQRFLTPTPMALISVPIPLSRTG